MKKIQTFEQFCVNEMMMIGGIPTNPKTGKTIDILGGIDEMNKEMSNLLGSSFKQATDKLDKAIDQLLTKVDGEKLLDAAEDYFGMSANKLTYSIVKSKLSQINELTKYRDYDDVRETDREDALGPLSEVKGGVAQKILKLLAAPFMLNNFTLGWMGTFVTWLVDKLVVDIYVVNPILSFALSLAAWLVIAILRKIIGMYSPKP